MTLAHLLFYLAFALSGQTTDKGFDETEGLPENIGETPSAPSEAEPGPAVAPEEFSPSQGEPAARRLGADSEGEQANPPSTFQDPFAEPAPPIPGSLQDAQSPTPSSIPPTTISPSQMPAAPESINPMNPPYGPAGVPPSQQQQFQQQQVPQQYQRMQQQQQQYQQPQEPQPFAPVDNPNAEPPFLEPAPAPAPFPAAPPPRQDFRFPDNAPEELRGPVTEEVIRNQGLEENTKPGDWNLAIGGGGALNVNNRNNQAQLQISGGYRLRRHNLDIGGIISYRFVKDKLLGFIGTLEQDWRLTRSPRIRIDWLYGGGLGWTLQAPTSKFTQGLFTIRLQSEFAFYAYPKFAVQPGIAIEMYPFMVTSNNKWSNLMNGNGLPTQAIGTLGVRWEF